MTCRECGKSVSATEAGLTMKLVDRAATEYLCYECLAKAFKTDRKALEDMARALREAGCTLFR